MLEALSGYDGVLHAHTLMCKDLDRPANVAQSRRAGTKETITSRSARSGNVRTTSRAVLEMMIGERPEAMLSKDEAHLCATASEMGSD